LLGEVNAESASLKWRLRDEVLSLETLELRGRELHATGSGTLRLADPLTSSDVSLDVAFTTTMAASAFLRAALSPQASPRHLIVQGPLGQPSIVLQ
jgi:hypothetical protein